MKKIVFIFTVLCLSVLFINTESHAKDIVKNAKAGPHATWSLSDEYVMTIKGTGAVTWKSLYKTSFVRDYYQVKIKKVIVKEGITKIENGALSGMESVTQFQLPDTLKSCGTFFGCYLLKKIKIPDNVTKIPYQAFEECDHLEEIILPKKLRTVERRAFYGCKRLKKIVFPDSVEEMEKNCVMKCRALEKVVLPKNLKKLEKNFTKCFGLRTIVNRSSMKIPLDTVSGKRIWKVGGKKAKILTQGKTAKSRGTKYRITYDLRGGKTTDRMPGYHYYGDELKLPRMKKKGYTFLGWRCLSCFTYGDEFVRYYGKDVKLVPYFVKFEVKNLEGGKIQVRIADDDFEWPDIMWREDYYPLIYVVRFSENEDMSGPTTSKYPYHKLEGVTGIYDEGIYDGFEIGKTYYIQFSYYYTDGEIGLELGDIHQWFLIQSIKIEK